MEKTRIKLEVYVDLDPVPGEFHSTDSARNVVGRILSEQIGHYDPMVSVGSKDSAEEICTCGDKYQYVQDMVEDGQVPYMAARFVWMYDQEGKSYTRTHLTEDSDLDRIIGALDIMKTRIIQKCVGRDSDS